MTFLLRVVIVGTATLLSLAFAHAQQAGFSEYHRAAD